MSSLGGVFSACFANLAIKHLYNKKNNLGNAQNIWKAEPSNGEKYFVPMHKLFKADRLWAGALANLFG